jgi:CPA2 family monovalent cation:H+ antiporter-2
VSPIPLYLIAGVLFGEGGLVQPDFSHDFIELGAEIGVILLLLTLGLEYTAQELRTALRTGLGAGVMDLLLNATPGALAALALGFGAKETLLLAGITYVSSSGIVAKLLNDLDRLGNRETPTILSILVMEDLAMAAYLPIAGAVLAGATIGRAALGTSIALAVVVAVLFVALRYGRFISKALSARSDEAMLLGVLGVTLLVAGVAQQLQVSAAVGAFLVGIALSGVVQERATALILPLRDLFAAVFFLFFGLQIDPSELRSSVLPALLLAVITAATKIATGVLAARAAGVGPRGQVRAGTMLTVRGEFSIVIAGLGTAAALDPELGGVAAAYVLALATAGPILTRLAERFGAGRQ